MAQRNVDALVEDYTTTTLVTISQRQSVLEVAKRMVERSISSIAITDEEDRIVGIVTERDIVNAITSRVAPDKAPASSLMTRPLVSITSNSHIEDAARTMISNRVRHLMVTDPHSCQVVGIITVTDLARYLKQNMTDEEIAASEVWQLFF
jgi:signal-transduction protein with cAMP-binding, CBS, and nucleotidyltransferase domain